jgi:hypothetical protein
MALPGLSSTAHAQTEEQLARARTLFTEGQAAYDAGRFQEAVTKMREAYDITHSAELAFNVARVYERMSEYADAVRYFRIYLREGQPDAEVRADVEARIEALRAAERRSRDQVFTAPPSDDELTREARTFFTRGVAMFRRGEYEARHAGLHGGAPLRAPARGPLQHGGGSRAPRRAPGRHRLLPRVPAAAPHRPGSWLCRARDRAPARPLS